MDLIDRALKINGAGFFDAVWHTASLDTPECVNSRNRAERGFQKTFRFTEQILMVH